LLQYDGVWAVAGTWNDNFGANPNDILRISGEYRPQACVTPRAYTKHMDGWKNPIEDERGVDISQIHRQLNLTVPERVSEMVHAANLLMTMQENARRFRETQSR